MICNCRYYTIFPRTKGMCQWLSSHLILFLNNLKLNTIIFLILIFTFFKLCFMRLKNGKITIKNIVVFNVRISLNRKQKQSKNRIRCKYMFFRIPKSLSVHNLLFVLATYFMLFKIHQILCFPASYFY